METKQFSKEELAEILEKHSLWLKGVKGGERANLSEANLSEANLSEANLSYANLSYAYLTRANLTRANLTRANLTNAYLSEANLSYANLSYAYLTRANLTRANLSYAYLTRANLSEANLTRANLTNAYLSEANLSEANLSEANLSEANLSEANLSEANLSYAYLSYANLTKVKDFPEREAKIRQIVAQGTLTVYKKLEEGKIATLTIPEEAKRVGGVTGRKCRAEYAIVKAIDDKDGKEAHEGVSRHDGTFIYKVGEKVTPDMFDDSMLLECKGGIHFFLTKEEAEDYS